MAVTVGIYTRISDDGEGDARGVARQEEDCRLVARARRWLVGPVYQDNDVSAYKRDVKRPEFDQMLADLKGGVIQGVVVYNVDRLARQPKDLERVIDLYEERPTLAFATLEGGVDLSTSDGRTMARIMVAFANKSSADTGRRVARKQLELAREGKPHGGRQMYGWSKDGTVDEAAKAEIDKAHDAILLGTRISAIRADWISRDIYPCPTSSKHFRGIENLSHKTVKLVLTNPALAGLVVYRGEVMLDGRGAPVKASWPAVTTPERLQAVTAALQLNRPSGERLGARKYLLSGIARCGVCGGGMRGSLRTYRTGNKAVYYACDNSGFARGCGKVARVGEPIDRLVIRLILADQQRRRHQAATAPEWDREDELGVALDEIDQLKQAKRDGKISVSTLLEFLPDLERQRDALLTEKNRLRAAVARAAVLTADAQDNWDALDLDRQRLLVLQSLKAVVVHPAGKGAGKKFNPDLIEPVWA